MRRPSPRTCTLSQPTYHKTQLTSSCTQFPWRFLTFLCVCVWPVCHRHARRGPRVPVGVRAGRRHQTARVFFSGGSVRDGSGSALICALSEYFTLYFDHLKFFDRRGLHVSRGDARAPRRRARAARAVVSQHFRGITSRGFILLFALIITRMCAFKLERSAGKTSVVDFSHPFRSPPPVRRGDTTPRKSPTIQLFRRRGFGIDMSFRSHNARIRSNLDSVAFARRC